MEAVIKTLRCMEKEVQASRSANSSLHGLRALELFLHMKPKTFPEHTKLSKLLLAQTPSAPSPSMPNASVSIDKSPSLCLQGIQLALQTTQDLAAIVLASLLVINLNREKISFKQPYTWENMHLQLAKKLLDIAALPLSSKLLSCLELLLQYHIHHVLVTTEFIPQSHASIDWIHVAKKLRTMAGAIPPFMEKLVVVCLQLQLHQRQFDTLITNNVTTTQLSKATWDMAYRLIWKCATGIEKSANDPQTVLALRIHGLRCLAYAQLPWTTYVQQLHRTGLLYKKYSQKSCQPLYVEMTLLFKTLYTRHPNVDEAGSLAILFVWLEHWVSLQGDVVEILDWVDLNILSNTRDVRWKSIMALLRIQLQAAVSSDSIELALDMLGPDLPGEMLQLAIRCVKRLIAGSSSTAIQGATYLRLLDWTTCLRQRTKAGDERDRIVLEEFYCIRMCIRTSIDNPMTMTAFVERAIELHAQIPATSSAKSAFDTIFTDAQLAAIQWFKQEQYQAIVHLATIANPFSPKFQAVLGTAFYKMHKMEQALAALENAVLTDVSNVDKYMTVIVDISTEQAMNSMQRVLEQCSTPDLPLKIHDSLLVQSDKWLRQLRKEPNGDLLARFCAALDLEVLVNKSYLCNLLRHRRLAFANFYVHRDNSNCLEAINNLYNESTKYLENDQSGQLVGWRAILGVELLVLSSYAATPCAVPLDQIRADMEKAAASIVANSPELIQRNIDPLYVDALQDACQLLGWTTFHHQLRRFSKHRWSLSLTKADKLLSSGDVDGALEVLLAAQNDLEKVDEKLVKYDQGRKLQLHLARAYCAKGFYEEAIVELKTGLKTCFQHVYYLGTDTIVAGADLEQKKMYFQSIEFSAWSLLHDTLSCFGRLGDVYAKLGLPSKSVVYIRRAQALALGLNYHIVAARRIALLGARVEMHKNNLHFAQSALERLVPITPSEIQDESWMAQACYENLLEGDILHVQSHYGPAQKSYKLSKHRIIPYYQQHKRLIRVVARSYRKLAENACRAYYHDKKSEFPVEAITAFQKSIKLSTSVVENSQCLHGVGLGVYHRALIQNDAKKLELLSQSVQALRESWFHVVHMHSRPHLLYRVCRDLTLALIETVRHTDLEMQKKLHWNMALTQAVGVRLDQGSELSTAQEPPTTPPEYFQWASETFQSHFTSSGIPPDWNIVFISLTTSKELVIHRIQVGSLNPSQLKFHKNNGTTPITVALPRTQFPMESYLNGLNKIITASNETLSGHTADEAQTWSSTQKKQWWNQRNHLDAQLQLLLEKAQDKLGHFLSLFVGRPAQLPRVVLEAYESIVSQCGVNLLQQELLQSLLWALHQHLLPRDMAIAGIRSIVPACTLSSVKFPVHSEPVAHGPTILICDEKVHTFPWEGLLVCKALAMSRMPNIFSVISTDKSSAVSRQKVRFMINPSGDLIHTESVMSPFLDKASQVWQWEGSKGPTSEAGTLMESYVKESDVFLYSGHGSGEEFVHRDVVAGYDRAGACLLLGCSSAKLKQEGIYLPEGMLLSYLAAKSRAVVGMLWDVTDRDIDRLSLKLLHNWFEEDMTLATALQRSRSECKLRSLNGLAAVCYGLPLLVDKGPVDVSME